MTLPSHGQAPSVGRVYGRGIALDLKNLKESPLHFFWQLSLTAAGAEPRLA